MSDSSILPFIVVIGGFLAGNYNYLALKNSLRYSGEDLRSMDPELSSIKWKFIVGNLVLIAAIFGFAFFFAFNLAQHFLTSIYKVLLPLVLSTSIYNALFALLTNVYPHPTKYNWNTFVYDPDADIKKIAFTQIIIDLAVIVLGLFLL